MNRIKYSFLLLVTVFVCMMPISAAAEDRTEGIIYGKAVFIHQSGVLFFGWEDKLCTALLDETGVPYDFEIDGSMPYEISSLAVSGDYIYLCTEDDGIFRVSLNESAQDTSAAQLICEDSPSSGFQIYDGYIYYRYGTSLYRVSIQSGEEEKLASGAADYELTNQGIYYVDDNGGLFYKTLDGEDKDFLCDTPEECRLLMAGDCLYFWNEGNNELGRYSLTEEAAGKITLQENLSKYYAWATPEYFVYDDEDYDDVNRYDFSAGTETHLENVSRVPFKEDAIFYNGILYEADSSDGTISLYDHIKDVAADYGFDKEEDKSQSSDSTENDAALQSNYDIAENIGISVSEGNARITSSHFELYLPIDANWNYEVISTEAIRVYYPPANDDGFGGTLVSIRAFDWADNSYSDFPEWSMAGLSNDKKYVAIFPTDLQVDPSDSAQLQEYQTLLEYVHRIDNENTDNPFIVLDD